MPEFAIGWTCLRHPSVQIYGCGIAAPHQVSFTKCFFCCSCLYNITTAPGNVIQEAEEQLQQSFRERARLEKQRGQLEKELASWSSKLGVSIDLPNTESVEASEASGSDQAQPWPHLLLEASVHVLHKQEQQSAVPDIKLACGLHRAVQSSGSLHAQLAAWLVIPTRSRPGRAAVSQCTTPYHSH